MNLPAIQKNLKNKRVVMRVDFNVPIERGHIADGFRLTSVLPAIRALQKKGASVILISHLETGGRRPSLIKVWKFLNLKIKNLRFSPDISGAGAKKAADSLKPGQVLLLENLRHNSGEEKNSAGFSKFLASLGDIYVNEAFSASHRRHASIVGVPRYLPSFAGPLFRKEVKNLSLALRAPRPFLLIVGGNKLETKTPLLKKFAKKADKIVIAGTLIIPFLFKKARLFLPENKIIWPKDLVVLRSGARRTIKTFDLQHGDEIYDFGPESLADIELCVKKSRFVLWNGPLGFVEGGFSHGTKRLAGILASAAAKTITGGGDTVAFLRRQKLFHKFFFVSTGGGAMLDFLASGTLPGIESLKKRR